MQEISLLDEELPDWAPWSYLDTVMSKVLKHSHNIPRNFTNKVKQPFVRWCESLYITSYFYANFSVRYKTSHNLFLHMNIWWFCMSSCWWVAWCKILKRWKLFLYLLGHTALILFKLKKKTLNPLQYLRQQKQTI